MAIPAQLLIEAFEKRFHATPDVFRAPGRVNLIGEHTDYNLGFVCPIAIDFACYAGSAPNRDGVLRVFSLNLDQGREWPVDRLASLVPAHDWTDYVIGVARQIPMPRGRDILIYSTVPVGSGLSSSAALEVSSALAAGWDLEHAPKLDLVKLCRRAENDYVGLPCGIMDQYISVFGQTGSAVKIDCRTLDHEAVALPAGLAIVAVNSLVKHELSQGAYRDRVAECARAAAILGVNSLRDAPLESLSRISDPVILSRARHVVTENLRVEQFVAASRGGDLHAMGQLFVESHRSLQHDYQVSCEELDFLVDHAIGVEGVYGARMTGGGFGGCTVNLLEASAVERFESSLRDAYQLRYGIDPAFYRVSATAGASKLS